MLIRTEHVYDHKAVNDLHDKETRERIIALRHNINVFMPEMSIICTHEKEIIGHAMLFPIKIARDENVKYWSLFMMPFTIKEEYYGTEVSHDLLYRLLSISMRNRATSIITDKSYYTKYNFELSDGTIYSSTGKDVYIRPIISNGGIGGISGCIEADENIGI